MALSYTAPTWTDGSGQGISASQLQAISDCIEGIVQGSDKAVHSISINGSTITFVYADGTQETVSNVDIKGIVSITKTGTAGLVDTYTILYSDGTTDTFTITNGEIGFSPEVTITEITGGHRVNITDVDHPSGQSFDVMDGDEVTKLDQTTYSDSGGIRTFSFTSAAITADSAFDFYCDVFGKNPTDAVPAAGSLQVKFNTSDNVTACRVYVRG